MRTRRTGAFRIDQIGVVRVGGIRVDGPEVRQDAVVALPAAPRWVAVVIAAIATLLVTTAFLLGYLPGDARGATRREWTMQTGGIAVVLALLSLIPLGWFRWVLMIGAGGFLVLSVGFWLTVGR